MILSSAEHDILEQLHQGNKRFLLKSGTWKDVDFPKTIKRLHNKKLLINNKLSFYGRWVVSTFSKRQDIVIVDDMFVGFFYPWPHGTTVIDGCCLACSEVFPEGFQVGTCL